MMQEPMVMLPIRVVEIVARLIVHAGEEAAVALSTLEPYMEADREIRERRLYDEVNEIDSDLAAMEGFLAESVGGNEMWSLYQQRGLARWEEMAHIG
jgi:hypothetical protein